MITGYDKEKVRGQSDHTFENIVTVLEKLFESPRPRTVACSRMAGYLVLDALVGNTDRHHQNWGVVVQGKRGADQVLLVHSIQLAPTFDHASSLGRKIGVRRHFLTDYRVNSRKSDFLKPLMRNRGIHPMTSPLYFHR